MGLPDPGSRLLIGLMMDDYIFHLKIEPRYTQCIQMDQVSTHWMSLDTNTKCLLFLVLMWVIP